MNITIQLSKGELDKIVTKHLEQEGYSVDRIDYNIDIIDKGTQMDPLEEGVLNTVSIAVKTKDDIV